MLLSGPIPGKAVERVFSDQVSFAEEVFSASAVFVSDMYQLPVLSLCHISSPPIRSAVWFADAVYIPDRRLHLIRRAMW